MGRALLSPALVRIVSALGKAVVMCALVVATCATSFANEADEKTAAVDDIFRDYGKAGSPGCALAIYRDRTIIYEKATAWRTSNKALR